jgi:hypothetical protein
MDYSESKVVIITNLEEKKKSFSPDSYARNDLSTKNLDLLSNETEEHPTNEEDIKKLINEKMLKIEKFNRRISKVFDFKEEIKKQYALSQIQNINQSTLSSQEAKLLEQSNLKVIEMNERYIQKSNYLKLKRILEKFEEKATKNKYDPKYTKHFIAIKKFNNDFHF